MRDSLKTSVASRISLELVSQERSIRWLARQVGTNDRWVGRRLSGEVRLLVEDVYLFAEALDVPVSRLMPEVSSDLIESVSV